MGLQLNRLISLVLLQRRNTEADDLEDLRAALCEAQVDRTRLGKSNEGMTGEPEKARDGGSELHKTKIRDSSGSCSN